MSALTTLYFYRQVGNQRVRVQFTVDADMTILEEKAAPITATANLVSAATDARKKYLVESGCTFETDETGQLKITSIPADLRAAMLIFSTSTPCNIPGCDELRAEYLRELEAIGSDCSDCDKGAIIRRLQPRALDLVRRMKGSQHGASAT